jgi:hypothetical protein
LLEFSPVRFFQIVQALNNWIYYGFCVIRKYENLINS